MKKILVYDVAAEFGGALSVLYDFYENAAKNTDDIKWIFVISKAELHRAKNIEVLSYPKVKKSWLHRVLFDIFYAPEIVKKYKPDVVFSLQNIMIPRIKEPQVIYMHQGIPFSETEFSFRESKKLWVIQNVLSILIKKSIKKSKKTVVQTKWIAEAVKKQTKIAEDKITVVRPGVLCDFELKEYNKEKARKTFIYPSSAAIYKNHKLVVDAVKKIVQQGTTDFEVLFTATNEQLSAIGTEVTESQIKCIGNQPREKIIELLFGATLLFPSKLETFGMPLAEAAVCGSYILAGDTVFAHEVLENYKNVDYFDVSDPDILAEKMQDIIKNGFSYESIPKNYFDGNVPEGWNEVIGVLKNIK